MKWEAVSDLIMDERLNETNIVEKTETYLLTLPTENWPIIKLHGSRIVDGHQRILVARKHGITHVRTKQI